MSRAQLALRVSDLEASITFYSKLFGTEPAKRREGYANFAITEPPLKLVLIEGEPDQETRLDHLDVEVETTEQVTATTGRLKDVGLDKVWVHGPGQEPWEVYVVKADADALGKSAQPDVNGDECCTSRPAAEGATAAVCACGACGP
ncbi:ArsI/CadI family heavy metal resistance metalloenzyme [Streptomyces sp. NPDC058430]|uniref:ArsI/CadI family heavy metal resistance metalloenzyme n=1 Tax=Streptomyces sp. NPDC058430 TaxID=3346495 RepID=UPI003652C7C9